MSKIADKIETLASNVFTLKKQRKLIEEDEKAGVDELRPLVVQYGEKSEPAYSQDSIYESRSFKIHNCASSTETINASAVTDLIRQKISEYTKSKNKEELKKWRALQKQLEITVPTIDISKFKFMAERNEIPEELRKVGIKHSLVYRLNIYPLNK